MDSLTRARAFCRPRWHTGQYVRCMIALIGLVLCSTTVNATTTTNGSLDLKPTVKEHMSLPCDETAKKLESGLTISIIPTQPLSLAPGESINLIISSKDDSNPKESVVLGRWASSSISVATVSDDGRVLAKSDGSACLTATVSGIQVSRLILVKKAAINPEVKQPATPTPTDQALQEEIAALMRDLLTHPSQNLVNRATELLSRHTALGKEEELERLLRAMLNKADTTGMILIGLSRHSVQEFDNDLAKMAERIDLSQPLAESLIAAIGVSGSRQSLEVLHNRSKLPFAAPAEGPSPGQLTVRRLIWQHYSRLSEVEAVLDATEFYNTPAGRFELEKDPAVTDLLVPMIESAAKNHDTLIRLLPKFEFFLGKQERVFGGPSNVPLDTGPSTSQRFRVCQAIERALLSISNPSPAILSVLLRFAQAVDPTLQNPAVQADYSAIEKAPWLLPVDAYALTNTDAGSRAWRITSRLRLGLPRDPLFFPEGRYEALIQYEQMAASKGARVVQGGFNRTESETVTQMNRFADGMLRTLIAQLDLDGSGITVNTSLQPSYDPVRPYRYISTFSSYIATTTGLATAFERAGIEKNQANSLAGNLVAKEFARKSLVLFSTIAARRRMRISDPVDVQKLDEVLDSLSLSASASGIIRSEIVSTINSQPSAQLDAHLPMDCSGVSPVLVNRRYSFDQNLYQEELEFRCRNSINRRITWVGAIPVSLLVALRRHPRLLDFPGVSLSSREFKVESAYGPPLMEDIDYIRSNPILVFPNLYLALENPEIPWLHVRDALQIDANSGYPYMFISMASQPITPSVPPLPITTYPPLPGLSKDAKAFLDLGLPGGLAALKGVIIAGSDDEFEQEKKLLSQPYIAALNFRLMRLEAERLRPIVENINTDKPCNNPIQCAGDFIGGLIVGGKLQDQQAVLQKQDFLKKIYKAIADATLNESYLQAWDLHPLIGEKIRSVVLREMVLRPSLKEFFAVYQVTSGSGITKYATFGGTLKEIPAELNAALRNDPSFLWRYNIDIARVSEGADATLALALMRNLRLNEGLRALNQTGYYATSSDPGLDMMPAPQLFRTLIGRIRAVELRITGDILRFVQGGVLPYDATPRAEFVGLLTSQIREIDKVIVERVQADTQPIIDQIEREKKARSEWTIGVSVTFGAGPPVFTGGVSYNSFGINFSTILNGDVRIAPAIGGRSLPWGFDLRLPRLEEKEFGENEYARRILADAAVSYLPATQVVQGTLYAPPQSGGVTVGTTVNLTGYVAPQDGPPPRMVVDTSIPSTWLRLPPLASSWKTTSDKYWEGIWLSGLVNGAWPQLSVGEQKALQISINAGAISDEMLALLIRRRIEAIEAENIKERQWVRTSVAEREIVPATFGPSKIPMTRELIAGFVESENRKSIAQFQGVLRDKRTQLKIKDDQLLDNGGLPAISITYGNDFAYMRWHYEYKLVDGSTVGFDRITETPYFLRDQIRKSPNGHIYEMYMTAAAGTFLQSLQGMAFAKSLLGAGEATKLRDSLVYNEQLKTVIDDVGTTILSRLTTYIQKYIDEIEAWIKSQPRGGNATEPFVPTPEGTPMLNFFPSPYEWSLRRDETVSDILLHQRRSAVGGQIRSGEVKIGPPSPPFP